MAIDPDELLPRKQAVDIVLGQDLSTLSEHELTARIQALEAEIARAKNAILARQATKNAASAFFRK